VSVTAAPARYRLSRAGAVVAAGPLALVAAQAGALARSGVSVLVSADGPGACRVWAPAGGGVCAEWSPPLVLFPDPADAGPPGWLARLQTLLHEGDHP
jgi:hypothetical protein